jgi:hypothetical protein
LRRDKGKAGQGLKRMLAAMSKVQGARAKCNNFDRSNISGYSFESTTPTGVLDFLVFHVSRSGHPSFNKEGKVI